MTKYEEVVRARESWHPKDEESSESSNSEMMRNKVTVAARAFLALLDSYTVFEQNMIVAMMMSGFVQGGIEDEHEGVEFRIESMKIAYEDLLEEFEEHLSQKGNRMNIDTD
jgi:hypothetical protein